MKLTRIVVLCLALLVAWASLSQAQQTPCDEIEPSLVDSVMIVETAGLPGDIIWVPLYIGNYLRISAISVHLEYDTNVIKPLIWYTDTTVDVSIFWDCRDTVINGNDTTVCDSVGSSTDTLTISNYYYNLLNFDSTIHYPQVVEDVDFPASGSHHRIKFLGLPKTPTDTGAAVDSGEGPVVEIGFEIDSTVDIGTSTTISFYQETVYSDSFPYPQIGCVFSHYADPQGYTIKFKTITGDVIVAAVPEINSFEASDSTIYEEESTTLYWNVSNATSITISPAVCTACDSIGSEVVSPSATTIYTLTATNDEDVEVQAHLTITVLQPGVNERPVFTEPTQTFYEIDQGQTVAFQVTATDADNDEITLTATSLPNNAAFGPTNPVVGVGSVTGNFSFTPDYVQLGTYQAAFTADDGKPGGTRQLTVSIQVNEIPYDRLFTTSAEGQVPVGGLAGTPQVLLPINLITAQTVYGVQFDFFYDQQYFEVDSFITTPRTEDYVIYDDIGGTPGEIRIVTFGVANEPVETDTASTAILYAVMSIDTVASWGDYPVYIENGWESVTPDPDFPSLPLVTDSGIIQVDRLGDVNLDKRVDVADAVNVVGYVLGNYGFSSRQFSTADVVVDVTIDVFDLVGIINLIFGIPPSPAAGNYISDYMATVSLDYPDLDGGLADVMVVRSELPEQIAGVQLEVRYDPSSVILGKPTLGEDATRMVLSSKDDGHGKLTVLLYFKNPFQTEDLIQVGQADLVKVPITARSEIEFGDESQMKLTKALLSTAAAEAVRVEGMDLPLPATFILYQNYPNPFNPTTTIEFSLGGSDDGSLTQHVNLDIYNILGQHVKNLVDKNLVPGSYQVDWDATNSGGRRVATGIYLYKLQVDKVSKSRKMVLLK
jgi:hypothetical protein